MADVDAVTLLSLPYELLVLTISWLNVHDILYSLKYVCRVLYTVANDPVTWARVVVTTCTETELRRVLGKYGGTVTVLRSFHGLHSEIFTLCPNLKELELHSHYAGNYIPTPLGITLPNLEFLSCGTFGPDELALCGGSLRALTTSYCPAPDTLTQCSGLTALNYSDFFALETLPIIPTLTSLKTAATGVSVEKWSGLSEQHPRLARLVLTEGESVPHDVAALSVKNMPATLTGLEVYCRSENENVIALARTLLIANTELNAVLLGNVPVDPVMIEQFAQLDRLRTLKFNLLAENFDPKQLMILKGRLDTLAIGNPPRDVGMVVAAMGVRPTELELREVPPGVLQYGMLLENLKELGLRGVTVTTELANVLAKNCLRTNYVYMSKSAAAFEAASALEPLFARLTTLTIGNNCSDDLAVCALGYAKRATTVVVQATHIVFIQGLALAAQHWEPRRMAMFSAPKGDLDMVRALAFFVNSVPGLKVSSLHTGLCVEDDEKDLALQLAAHVRRAVYACDPEMCKVDVIMGGELLPPLPLDAVGDDSCHVS